MTNVARVLWEEGMFLGPQHFQQADRHHGHVLDERIRAIQPRFWGYTELEIDERALHSGNFLLTRCAGVFSDGTCFRIPEDDPIPGERRVQDAFHSSLKELKVSLAIPTARPGSMVAARDKRERATARYVFESRQVPEEVSGMDRDLKILWKNVRVLLGGEPPDDHTTMPLAILERAPSGGYQLAPRFAPPCLYVAASPLLVGAVKGCFEDLVRRSEEILRERGPRPSGEARLTMGEGVAFWLLHTLNSYLPLVMHYKREPRVHPETVYKCLASLVGELCTFLSTGKQITDIPPYVHDDPAPCFLALRDEIKNLPATLMTKRVFPIRLEPVGHDTWHGRVQDERRLTANEFYFGVKIDLPTGFDTKRDFPNVVKVSSPQKLLGITDFSDRGVVLTHVANPDKDLSHGHGGFQFFQLTMAGEHWDEIKKARTIAIFVRPPFLEAEIVCLALEKAS